MKLFHLVLLLTAMMVLCLEARQILRNKRQLSGGSAVPMGDFGIKMGLSGGSAATFPGAGRLGLNGGSAPQGGQGLGGGLGGGSALHLHLLASQYR